MINDNSGGNTSSNSNKGLTQLPLLVLQGTVEFGELIRKLVEREVVGWIGGLAGRIGFLGRFDVRRSRLGLLLKTVRRDLFVRQFRESAPAWTDVCHVLMATAEFRTLY